jgi:hypothetical protein
MGRKIISSLFFAIGSVGLLTLPVSVASLLHSPTATGLSALFILLLLVAVLIISGLSLGKWRNRQMSLGIMFTLLGFLELFASYAQRRMSSLPVAQRSGDYLDFANKVSINCVIFSVIYFVIGLSLMFVFSKRQR